LIKRGIATSQPGAWDCSTNGFPYAKLTPHSFKRTNEDPSRPFPIFWNKSQPRNHAIVDGAPSQGFVILSTWTYVLVREKIVRVERSMPRPARKLEGHVPEKREDKFIFSHSPLRYRSGTMMTGSFDGVWSEIPVSCSNTYAISGEPTKLRMSEISKPPTAT
jgi:hypothetical protein